MKNSRLLNIILKIFLIIYLIFSIGLCLAPFKYSNSTNILLLHLLEILLLICFASFRKNIKQFINKNKIKKIVFPIIIVIGILLRISLVFINYNELSGEGDYQTFFYNASSLSETGEFFSKSYVELFPYLMPYIIILACFFKLFNVSYQSIVILNIILDLLIPLCFYFIFSNTKIKKTSIALWLLSPINLVWCMVCAPIVLVNFGITLSILVFSRLLKHINSKLFILYSLLTGCVMGISNTFRPLMPIMLIAIMLYFIYIIMSKKEAFIHFILSFILIVLSFFGVKFLCHNIMNKIIDGNISTTSGWTLYVGSNIESNGMRFSSAETVTIFSKDIPAEEIQKEFKELAINRYKNNGIKNIKLFIEKTFVLVGNVAEYTYDTLLLSVQINNNLILTIAKFLLNLYIDILILLNIINVIIDIYCNALDKYDIFFMLLYMGLISAHIFVEVSPRYYMPALIPLTIISGISLYKLLYLQTRK